jgi:uncharacterized protein (DUF2062 family)
MYNSRATSSCVRFSFPFFCVVLWLACVVAAGVAAGVAVGVAAGIVDGPRAICFSFPFPFRSGFWMVDVDPSPCRAF